MNGIISFYFAILILGACNLSTNKAEVTSENNLVTSNVESTNDKETSKQIPNCEKCNIEYVRDIKLNIKNLTEEQIDLFLCSFDVKCSNNVEFTQFSNKVLFLLLSKYPLLTIKSLAEGDDLSMTEIKKALQNPISDRIDLKELYEKVEEIEGYQETKEIVLNSIQIAIEKYN